MERLKKSTLSREKCELHNIMMCVWYDTIPRTYCVSLHASSCYHFLQWMSKCYHHGMIAPHCRQPLNLGAQAESGTFADTCLLLTTRQIGAVGAMWEKLIPPFYFDINIHVFNNEFHTNCAVTPQTKPGDAAVVALLPTSKMKLSGTTSAPWEKILPIFYFDGMVYLFQYVLMTRPCHDC